MKFFLIISFFSFSVMNIFSSEFKPPKAKMEPVQEKIHGYEFTDYYRWLEDKTNPETLDWSKKQHEYTVNFLKSNTNEIPGLREEISAHLDRDLRGAPFYKGNREFFYFKKKGDAQSKLFTVIKNKEILIFDPIQVDPSGNSAITAVVMTRDGNKAAIGMQFKGNEISTYRIIDTKNGKVLGEPITGLSSFGWTYDEKGAYITVRTKEIIEKQEPIRTYLHTIGTDRKNDKFMIAPEDAKNFASMWDTDCGTFTFISEGDFWTNSLKIRKPGTSDEPKLIYPLSKYKVTPQVKDGKLYVLTNHEAPNYRIMTADAANPDFSNWKDIIPESETVIRAYVITSDYLIVQDRKDVLSRLTAYDLNGKLLKEIELPELGNVSSISYHKESNSVYVNLATFTSPGKLYKLDGKTLKWEFIYQDKSPINTDNITSKQVFYTSKDGQRVPMFIIHRKDIKLDGNNPALVYGYGGFNVSQDPNFIGTTASFINRGGVYAITNLRGGSEYGEKWHEDGMLFKKQNTFDDFIAAAEYLIAEKYTNSEKLAARGGSNGGLLIGAVITQRPDLYKAAVCAVPLLDMVRYHKFLIARYWIPEYGDPEVYEDFMNILQYSPQHNIRKGYNYPAMLIKAGENDARVDPLHAKKFAAALQNNPGQTNPIMLYVDFESGHGSGKSTAHQINDIELEWRFVMSSLGMN
ncbi:MAG: S9 family peptidase [Candidatus Kapabacteria bacterium]|nr:S9 family peptidase [Ignavibacteriota bacterium]MCW5884078.1 S9 family peptidase [Candidatus Kapabacteria bacterium]